MRKHRGDLWTAGVASFLALCLSGTEAQADPPYDPAIDVQLFDLTPGPRSFMSVGDASLSTKEQYSVDFLLTFLTDPFVIYNIDENQDEIIDTRTDVVSSMFAGQFVGAYGLTDDLQLGVALPLVFSISGQGLDPNSGNMSTGGLQASGLGDLRLEVKGRILRKGNIGAAWTGGLTVPTSFGAGGSDYLGDNLPAARGGAAAHWDADQGRIRVGASLGAVLRKPRKIYASEVGQQLTYGVGASFKMTDDFSLIAEAFGRTALTAIDLDASPLEVAGGLRAKATKSFSVLAGGGVGVLSGIGAPGLRFVVSVGYAPDLADTDGDGISNMSDKCPLLKEDFDEFEDSDGCPEDDNDGDRREDAVDQCPNDKEDIDGFEDDDGCPEYDNDADGITDAEDRCPLDAEDGRAPYEKDGCPADKRDSDDDGVSDLMDACPDDYEDEDGFEDWDGCPEADNDQDGIPDEDDACPLCPEDKDGFEDDNGCPDLDNDNDGIADTSDQCPDEAEVINGNADEDGCPDQGGAAVATLEGNILKINLQLRFNSRNELRNKSDVRLIARVMRMSPDVSKWRIVVAARKQRTEELSREKSQAQADAIRAVLVEAGISEDSIEAKGAVSDNQIIAIAAVERRDADSEFICPASLQVKGRQQPEAPAAAPVTEAALPRVEVVPPAEAAPDIDSDGDTVVDRLDNCPQEAGSVENGGCKKKQAVNLVGGKLELLDRVEFTSNKAKIRSSSFALLRNVADVLKAHPEIALIRVEGHTDSQGDDDKNKTLSQERAEAVVQFLVSQGVDASRLEAKGFGEETPIADNETKDGRATNRRVEFKFAGP